MDGKKINLDITEKFKSFIEKGERYCNSDVLQKHKKSIDEGFANNNKAITKNVEKMGNYYILSFSFGQIDMKFWEFVSTNLTLLALYDEYKDEINFMTLDGRPFKIRELFHEDEASGIKEKMKRVCKKCGNTNRDIAIYCDLCGNKL